MKVPYIAIPAVTDVESLRMAVLNQVNSMIEQINRPDPPIDIDMKGYKLYNVKTPSNDLDAANKKYVDDAVRAVLGRSGGGRRVTNNITSTVQVANILNVTLTANTNITAPLVATEGQILIVFITQGAGPYDITFEASDFASGVSTGISPVNGSVSTFVFVGRADGLWWPAAVGFSGI